jgi:hypothetical protein
MTYPEAHIDTYSFGRMSIDGAEHTSDLILLPGGRVVGDWWRDEGHLLQVQDLGEVFDAGPERLIVGIGAYGVMDVSEAVRDACRERGIELVIERTGDAVDLYNAARKESVAAAFHLTC